MSPRSVSLTYTGPVVALITPFELMLYGSQSGQRYGTSTAWITEAAIPGSAAPPHVRQFPGATWYPEPWLPLHLPLEAATVLFPNQAHRIGCGVKVVSIPPYCVDATQPPPVDPHPYTTVAVAWLMTHPGAAAVTFRSESSSSGLPAG